MELKLNPQILSEYFSQFRDNTSFHGGLSALYHNREILYTTDNIDDFSFLETIPELPSNTSLSDVLHNRYVNSVTIPALDLTIIITGTLTSLATQPNNMLMILITLFICLLLVLMFHFFQISMIYPDRYWISPLIFGNPILMISLCTLKPTKI